MGAEILYCYKCNRRLLETDFGNGEALKIGTLSTCIDCADDLLAKLTPEQRRAVLRKAEETAAKAGPAARPAPVRQTRQIPVMRGTTTGRIPRIPPPAPSRKPLTAIAALGGGFALLLLLLLFGGSSSPPPEPEPEPRRVAPRRPPKPSPRPPPTDTTADVEAAQRKALIADIAAIEREARAKIGTGAYGEALDLLKAARSRRRDPEWKTVVDRLEKEAGKALDDKYRKIEAQAVKAKQQGASVDGFRQELARWGTPAQVAALEKALQAIQSPAPAAGLVLHLRLDETSGTEAADATGGAAGRVVGAATWERGRFGNAIRLNGVDAYIVVADRPALNPKDGITIAAWVNAKDWLGNYRIAQKGADDNQYRLTREKEGMLFEIGNVGQVVSILPDDGWHHLAATYDGKDMRIYWDGVRAAQKKASGRIPGTSDPLCIGTKREGAPAGDYFLGLMDEILIYNRALTEDEIAAMGRSY